MIDITNYAPAQIEAITALYTHYVKTTAITFDLEPPSIEQMGDKLQSLKDGGYPVCMALNANKQLLGFAYASPYRPKQAYQHTAEVTIYVQPDAHGQGIGSALMHTLINDLNLNDQFHLAIAMIADDAKASIKLHKKFGFADVGYLAEVGHKLGRWHGVNIMQKKLTAHT